MKEIVRERYMERIKALKDTFSHLVLKNIARTKHPRYTYEGIEIVNENEEEYIMVCRL